MLTPDRELEIARRLRTDWNTDRKLRTAINSIVWYQAVITTLFHNRIRLEYIEEVMKELSKFVNEVCEQHDANT